MNNKANFSHWLEQQKHKDGKGGESSEYSMFGTIAGITDGFSAQMLELQGSLPDVNGLTGAAFRERMTYSIYLLLASVGCGILAVVVGLPTIALKPAKFVVFMSLSTLCSIGSVIVMQKPSEFFASVIEGGFEKSFPIVLLITSLLVTLYVAIFIHEYIYTIVAGAMQVVCILYYLSSFIPGGQKGLMVLLRTGWAVVSAACYPCVLAFRTLFGSIFSD
jgi:hypothetical protein